MPVKECQRDGARGWKCGDAGKCYVGPGAKRKAINQCIAIGEEPSAKQVTLALDTAAESVLAHEDRLAAAAATVLAKAGTVAAKRFREVAGATVASLTAAGDDEADWTIPHPDELIDVDAVVAGLRGKSDPIRRSAIDEYGSALGELHPELDWNASNPLVGGALAGAAQHVRSIGETTQLNLMRIVRGAHEEGLSVDDTAKAIRAGMSEASTVRGRLIARTELAAVTNGGSLAATKLLSDAGGGPYWKRWMTAPGATYPRHEDYEGLDGQTVGLEDAFDVGGFALQFPGDPDGPPEEICNCRCTLAYVSSPDEPMLEPQGPPEMPDASEDDAQAEPLGGIDLGELAGAVAANADAVEPYVSQAMRAAVEPLGGQLEGFGQRLKTEGAIERKAGDLLRRIPGLPPPVAAGAVHDALRYTAVYRPGEYVDKMTKTLDALAAAGIKAERVTGSWAAGEPYAGTNAVLRTPSGARFEVQFHTPDSLAAREAAQGADWNAAVAGADAVPRPIGAEGFRYDGHVTADVGITPFREGVDDPVGFYDSEKYRRFSQDAAELADRFDVELVDQETATGVWEGSEEPSVRLIVRDGDVGVRAFGAALGRQYRQDGVAIFTPGLGDDVIAHFPPADPDRVYAAMAQAGLPAGRLLDDGGFEIIGSGPEFVGQLDRLAGDLGARYDAELGRFDLLEGTGEYEQAIGDSEGAGAVPQGQAGRAAGAPELAGRPPAAEGARGAPQVAGPLEPLPADLAPFDLPVGGLPVYRTESAHAVYKGKASWGEGRYFKLSRQEAADLQLGPEAGPEDFPNPDLVDAYTIPAEARLVSLDADAVNTANAGLEGEDLKRKVLASGYDGVYVKTESPNLGGDQIVLYRDPQAAAAAPAAPGGKLVAPPDVSPPPPPQQFQPPYPPSEAARFGPDRLWGAHAEIGRLQNIARAELPELGDAQLNDLLWAKGGKTRKGALGLEDLAGDQQVHTFYSDGHADVRAMVEEALAHGEQRIVISDHSHLLTSEEITEQHSWIDQLNEEFRGRIQVLKGVEANILVDGTLDLAPEELARFDVVNAAVHQAQEEASSGQLALFRESNTARLLKAMDNPELDVLVHPHSVPADWDAVAQKAAQRGVSLEVNGRDMLRNGRQEAAADMIAAAKRHGAKLVIGSDAHNPGDLVDFVYAMRFASQHGVTLDDLAPVARAERVAADPSISIPDSFNASRPLAGEQAEVLGGGMNEVWKVETKDGREFVVKPEPNADYMLEQGFDVDEPLRGNVEPGNDLGRERAAYVVSRVFNEVGGEDYHVYVPPYRIGEFTRVPEYDGMPLSDEAETAKAGIAEFVPGTEGRTYSFWEEDVRPEQLRSAALYDAVIGNTDRHAGNFLFGDDDNLWLIDHGLAFPAGPAEDPYDPGIVQFQNAKLVDASERRQGIELTDREVDFLRRLADEIRSSEGELRDLLSPLEIRDMLDRIGNMIDVGGFYPGVVNTVEHLEGREGPF